jgi:hypothetical protein
MELCNGLAPYVKPILAKNPIYMAQIKVGQRNDGDGKGKYRRGAETTINMV